VAQGWRLERVSADGVWLALEQARQFYPLVKPDSGQAGMSADQPAPPEEDDEP
jgi:hypothetical protein